MANGYPLQELVLLGHHLQEIALLSCNLLFHNLQEIALLGYNLLCHM